MVLTQMTSWKFLLRIELSLHYMSVGRKPPQKEKGEAEIEK